MTDVDNSNDLYRLNDAIAVWAAQVGITAEHLTNDSFDRRLDAAVHAADAIMRGHKVYLTDRHGRIVLHECADWTLEYNGTGAAMVAYHGIDVFAIWLPIEPDDGPARLTAPSLEYLAEAGNDPEFFTEWSRADEIDRPLGRYAAVIDDVVLQRARRRKFPRDAWVADITAGITNSAYEDWFRNRVAEDEGHEEPF